MREPAKPLQLGDRAFITSPLPADKALRVLTRLTKLVGETVLQIASNGSAALDNVGEEVFTFAVQTLVERLDEEEVNKTVVQLLTGMRCQGHEEDVSKIWPSLFAGSIMDLFKVLQYSLEINYSDFFDVLRSRQTPAAMPEEKAAG